MSAPSTVEDPHLLVVDDDERLRQLLHRYLTSNGYRVTAAQDAADARSLMKSIAFDLLVLDVMMPGESGFELTKSVRTTSQVPILILTAKVSNSALTTICPSRSSRASCCCGWAPCSAAPRHRRRPHWRR